MRITERTALRGVCCSWFEESACSGMWLAVIMSTVMVERCILISMPYAKSSNHFRYHSLTIAHIFLQLNCFLVFCSFSRVLYVTLSHENASHSHRRSSASSYCIISFCPNPFHIVCKPCMRCLQNPLHLFDWRFRGCG